MVTLARSRAVDAAAAPADRARGRRAASRSSAHPTARSARRWTSSRTIAVVAARSAGDARAAGASCRRCPDGRSTGRSRPDRPRRGGRRRGVERPPAGLAETAPAAARDQIVAATGLEPAAPLPAAEWVDRGDVDRREPGDDALDARAGARSGGGGADAPASGPLAALQTAGGAVVAAEIGGLLGLFARRVLGQYEFNLLDPAAPPRLLFVGPNLDRADDASWTPTATRCVTWVDAARDHARGAVRRGAVAAAAPGRRAGGAARRARRRARPARAAARRASTTSRRWPSRSARAGCSARSWAPSGARCSTTCRARWGWSRATPSGRWTARGAEVLRDVDALRAAMDRRREDRAPLLRILDRLLGFDLKLRSTRRAEQFCDAVVRRPRRVRAARRLGRRPTSRRRSAELAAPAAWLARTASAA